MSNVVIIDHHDAFRCHLESFITAQRDCVVTGSTGEAFIGLELVRTTRPAVVLIDVGIPGTSGLQLVARTKADAPGATVVLLGENESVEYTRAAMQVGAHYISKTKISRDLPKLLNDSPADGIEHRQSRVSAGSPKRDAHQSRKRTDPAAGLAQERSEIHLAVVQAALASVALFGGIIFSQIPLALASILTFLFLSYRQLTLPRLQSGNARK